MSERREVIHGLEFVNLTDYQRTVFQAASAAVLQAALRAVDHYNHEVRGERSAPIDWSGTVECIARCARYGLNPDVDAITMYMSHGKLVFIPALETYSRKCAATGQIVGIKKYTRVREDKALLAVAEIVRYQKRPDATWGEYTYTNEVNVAQWKAQNIDGKVKPSAHWVHTPESQAMVAALRGAYRTAFADELKGMTDVEEGGDGATSETGASDGPTPSQQAALTSAAAGTASASDGAAAARAVLAQARVPVAAPAPPAPAAAPAPPAPAAAPAPPAPAADDLHAVATQHGLDARELAHMVQRTYGCGVAELTPKQRERLRDRLLPAGPALSWQWQETETLREAFLADGRTPAAWDAFCAETGAATPYNARYLRARDAVVLIQAAESLLRGE